MYAEYHVVGSELTSNAGDGFLARHIGDVDEGVVERGEDAVGG